MGANIDSVKQLQAAGVPSHGFLYTPSDATNIIDPNTSAQVEVHAITTTVDGTVRVKFKDSAASVDLPVYAGVRRSGIFTKIFSTGTTAGITAAGVICEY